MTKELNTLIKEFGEEEVVNAATKFFAQAEKRRAYSNSPAAKQKAAERRTRQKAEIEAFRKWKASKK